MSTPAMQKGAEPCGNNHLNTLLLLTFDAVLWFLAAPTQAALLKPTLVCCKTPKKARPSGSKQYPGTLPSARRGLKTEQAP